MARVSFTLRRPSTAANVGGSFVRYDPSTYNTAASAYNAASLGVWVIDDPEGTRDYDSALRADSLVVVPEGIGVETGYFEVSAASYGTVNLKAGFPILINASGVPDISVGVPEPYEVVVVYSSSRFPISVEDGEEVSRAFVGVDKDIPGLPEGKWAYFSLFVRYRSTNDDYYLLASSLEVLVPKNYGSTLLLWERIPEFHRDQDDIIGLLPSNDGFLTTENGKVSVADLGPNPLGIGYGPLFRFLSIFGFEMDRKRTLLDYLMVSKDPLEANSSSLRQLAGTVAPQFVLEEMNLLKLRNILSDWVYVLKRKGTARAIFDSIRLVSNCESEVNESTRTLTVFSQRVNYCWDPQTGNNALGTAPLFRPAHLVEAIPIRSYEGFFGNSASFSSTDPSTFPSTVSGPYVPGMVWGASAGTFNGISAASAGSLIMMYGDPDSPKFAIYPKTFEDTAYDVSPSPITRSGTVYTTDNSYQDEGITHIWIRLLNPIPVKLGDTVYASTANTGTAFKVVAGRLVNVTTNKIVGEGSYILVEENEVAFAPASTSLNASGWTLCFMEVLVDMSGAGAAFDFHSILLERNYLGPYFDGDKISGTWVIGSDGLTTDKDYRWTTRSSYNADPAGPSISVYTEEYFKAISLIQMTLKTIMPVTEFAKYDLDPATTVYDGIPGLAEIDAYYDSLP